LDICIIYPETEIKGPPKGKVIEEIEGQFFQGSQKVSHRKYGTSRATHRLTTACIEINRAGMLTVQRISP
jgi:hypothetical protein